MRTSKPFATISYNSKAFLKEKLDKLVEDSILDFYMFIEHTPEEDELKGHIHLFMQPSIVLDTVAFKDYFKEIDKKKPDKPLNCTIFCSSKFDDWYLYAIHDKAYLLSKGQKRKYHYHKSNIVTNDMDYMEERIRCIDRSKFVGMERIKSAIDGGIPFSEMVRLGQVPIQLIGQYQYAYECLRRSTSLDRHGRLTHSPNYEPVRIIDEESGEILLSSEKEKEPY